MMLNMEKEFKRIEERRNHPDNLEPPDNDIHIYAHGYTNDSRGLVAGDEDILWLYENDIWLYRCNTCRSIYYAHKEGPWECTCPYCHYHFNIPLMNYDDLRDAIMAIKEFDPCTVKGLQQIIKEAEEKE